MAQSTLKVAVILAVIFLAVVGTSWIFATSVSSEADVAREAQSPGTAKVALTVVAPQPPTQDSGTGG